MFLDGEQLAHQGIDLVALFRKVECYFRAAEIDNIVIDVVW